MKALVLTAIREMTLQEVPQPKIVHPSDVLVRIRACGVCGSEMHSYLRETGRRVPPLIMGHEASGEVVEVGAAATGFAAGDRVTIQPWLYCGLCPACVDGKQLFCPERRLLGMHVPGAFAEYVVVPAANLYRVPDSLPLEHAALAEPIAVALHAVGRANFKPYETVAVIGAGPIGLLLISVLNLMGLQHLIAIDLIPERLALAKEMGADKVINSSQVDAVEACKDVVGPLGVDHVFEVVGIPATFRMSLELVRMGGELIWIGNNKRYAELDVQAIVTREVDIRASYAFSLGDFGRALTPISAGHIHLDPLVTRRATLDEGPHVFEELSEDPGIKCLLLP